MDSQDVIGSHTPHEADLTAHERELAERAAAGWLPDLDTAGALRGTEAATALRGLFAAAVGEDEYARVVGDAEPSTLAPSPVERQGLDEAARSAGLSPDEVVHRAPAERLDRPRDHDA